MSTLTMNVCKECRLQTSISYCKPIIACMKVSPSSSLMRYRMLKGGHSPRRLANHKYRVYITASNAKMLRRDLETVLGGRYLDISVFPYSFSEYLKAVEVLLSKNWQYGRKANELQRHSRTYFDWGGFPELVHFQEK